MLDQEGLQLELNRQKQQNAFISAHIFSYLLG